MDSVYLDNNSTTLAHPEVVAAMVDCLGRGYLNPASQHEPGRRARRVLEEARETMGRLLGANLTAPRVDRVIFTSGGTESNNLAVRGLPAQPGEILVSGIEHPSVLAAADELTSAGYVVRRLPVDAGGHVAPAAVREMLGPETRLVCVMMGNNEVGTLQPIAEIAALCAAQDVPLHTDAVQVVGKTPVDFRELGAASLALTAHKFHGPRGIGALLLRHGSHLRPLVVGGSQQLGLRAGTEPVVLAVGMARALELFHEEGEQRSGRLRSLRDRLENALLTAAQPAVVNGCEPRLPHTCNISFPGIDRQALVMALDRVGVACSTGAACTSGASQPSHVLIAMGCAASLQESSLRLSVGALTTETEVDWAIARILSVVNNLRRSYSTSSANFPARDQNQKAL